MPLKKLLQADKDKNANWSMDDSKVKGFVVEYGGLQYLTKKGLREAIGIHQLLSLLAENRVSDE